MDLLNEIVTMGFSKEEALKQIDASLDELFDFENRKELAEEEINDDLYEIILFGFQYKLEGKMENCSGSICFISNKVPYPVTFSCL